MAVERVLPTAILGALTLAVVLAVVVLGANSHDGGAKSSTHAAVRADIKPQH